MTRSNNSSLPLTDPAASSPVTTGAPVVTPKKRLSERITRTDQPNLKQAVNADLLKVVTAKMEPKLAEQWIRKIAITATGAIGASILTYQNEAWAMSDRLSTGRVPASTALAEEMGDELSAIYEQKQPHIRALKCLDNLPAIWAPLVHEDTAVANSKEIFLLVLKNNQKTAVALQVFPQIIAALALVNRTSEMSRSVWQLGTLSAIMELVTHIEESDDIKSACDTVANEVVSYLGCDSAAIGFKKKDLQLKAISGIEKMDKSSRIVADYTQTLYESKLRDEQALYPAKESGNAHLLLAHKQLAASVHSESAISQPLKTSAGDVVGAWVLTGPRDLIHSDACSQFLDTASPHVATAMVALSRAQKSWLSRMTSLFFRKTKLTTRLMIAASILGLGLLMLLPITYKVRCHCVVEPVLRRFAVAPFEGLIETGFVEPGDIVEKDQVLAEIDGHTIRWELLGVKAERRQSLRQRDIELYDRNVPKTLLAELETRRLKSEESILKYKEDHLLVRSPIAGVVLSGSLERAEAASVNTGQVLFEIGPTSPVKIEIAIPAEEASQVKQGHPVNVWIEGQEDRCLKSKIARITPRSETRDAKNVFIAEVEFDNEDDFLRPGMKGVVRVDAETRTLGWSLFHKPINYVRANFTLW